MQYYSMAESRRINISDTYLPPPILGGAVLIQEKHVKETGGNPRNVEDLVARFCKLDKITSQSNVLKPGLEQQHSILPAAESNRRLKTQRKLEREKTKGEKWFNMPATEMTEELKNDLSVLQMRSVLNPKQFYKKNDLKVLPKYFQVGTVQDDAADFYCSRIPKKQRKRTLVEELLADAEFRRYNKKKYVEAQVNQKRFKGAHRHMKRLKTKR